MSGVRVNLLPREAEERERGRRAIAALAGGFAVLLLVLVGLFFFQSSRVDGAREDLRAAEAERDAVRQEVDELERYASLQQRRDASVEVVKRTMATHTSFAGILQDVAAVMPTDTALTSLTVQMLTDPEFTTDFDLGGPAYGRLTAAGETLEGHAPGIERLLLDFDKVAAFFQLYLSDSTTDDEGITIFNIESDLGSEVYTGRYLDGLPEALR